jgi:hypothetical protein
VSALAVSVVALVAVALLCYLAVLELDSRRRRNGRRGRRRHPAAPAFDPGAERRAERRARLLLKSIVNADEWEMYRDLGFIRVLGRGADGAPQRRGRYGYLIYPHKPIVAYLPGSNSLLSEYCVEFREPGQALHAPKLPDSDDVLAKWLTIKADEHRLIREANMHLPGRQVDPQRVRRDLWRLAEWERNRRSSGRRRPAPSASGVANAEVPA